ncbi:MAG: hypothetical protein IIA77_09670 [Proteobacteria bacterium]|nr:hypothetical protein [Pseudomonadota bacterium]
MVNKNYIPKIFITLILIYPFPVLASEYTCTIQAVLKLNDVGLYTAHGWGANYMNRKFFLDRETGKVIGTTALKARLTNFNKTSSPKILLNDKETSSYKVVTIFEEKGQFSSLRIYENTDRTEKPFSYQTSVGMLLTGTCVENTSK